MKRVLHRVRLSILVKNSVLGEIYSASSKEPHKNCGAPVAQRVFNARLAHQTTLTELVAHTLVCPYS